MANINLLPWREARRRERKRQFVVSFLATLGGAVAALLIWDLWVNRQMDYQQSRNQRLSEQIALLDQEVAEIRDLQRKRNESLSLIQALQGNRPVIVRWINSSERYQTACFIRL